MTRPKSTPPIDMTRKRITAKDTLPVLRNGADLLDEAAEIIQAQAATITRLRAERDALRGDVDTTLQKTGDGIADMFEQLIKGSWQDNHGHDVLRNKAMCELKTVLIDLMQFRTTRLGYTPPDFALSQPDPAEENDQ